MLWVGRNMDFKFIAMNEEYAKEMINNWKYEALYSIYDYSNEAEYLLDEKNWGFGKFWVLDKENNLVGELTIDLFKEINENSEDDGYVDIETYKNNPNEIYEMWIGFGLRPDLTGKGLGKYFVAACIEFAIKHHKYKGEYIRLGVAEFNKRAIKTYEKTGFEVFNTYEGEIGEENLKILWMKKGLHEK